MRKFDESVGQMRRRVASGVVRKPLRSFAELCDELGIPQRSMKGFMNKHCGPQPKLRNQNRNTQKASWYDPEEFRAWWETVKGSTC